MRTRFTYIFELVYIYRDSLYQTRYYLLINTHVMHVERPWNECTECRGDLYDGRRLEASQDPSEGRRGPFSHRPGQYPRCQPA